MSAEIGCADKHSATRISHLEYEMTVHFLAKRITAKSIGSLRFLHEVVKEQHPQLVRVDDSYRGFP